MKNSYTLWIKASLLAGWVLLVLWNFFPQFSLHQSSGSYAKRSDASHITLVLHSIGKARFPDRTINA